MSVPRVQCGYSRKVACGRSASIPPILEGDTDTWEEEDGGEAADKKQSRKRYRVASKDVTEISQYSERSHLAPCTS